MGKTEPFKSREGLEVSLDDGLMNCPVCRGRDLNKHSHILKNMKNYDQFICVGCGFMFNKNISISRKKNRK